MPTNVCAEPDCQGEVHYGGLAIGRTPDGGFSDPPWYWVHFNTLTDAQVLIPSYQLPAGVITGDLTTDGKVRCIDRSELLDVLGI
jgi:hypothetical protein